MEPRGGVLLAIDRPPSPTDDVTASEIACYAYCAKAWHLQYVLGVDGRPEASMRRTVGVAQHRAHGRRVAFLSRLGRRRRLLVTSLLALAALALFAAVLL